MPLMLSLLWILTCLMLLLWSGLCWLTHALLQDPEAQVLALQRGLHSLSDWRGPAWATDLRDGLILFGDNVLLLLSMGLGALTSWWPGAIRTLDIAVWIVWLLGGLFALVVAAVLHAALRAAQPASPAPVSAPAPRR